MSGKRLRLASPLSRPPALPSSSSSLSLHNPKTKTSPFHFQRRGGKRLRRISSPPAPAPAPAPPIALSSRPPLPVIPTSESLPLRLRSCKNCAKRTLLPVVVVVGAGLLSGSGTSPVSSCVSEISPTSTRLLSGEVSSMSSPSEEVCSGIVCVSPVRGGRRGSGGKEYDVLYVAGV